MAKDEYGRGQRMIFCRMRATTAEEAKAKFAIHVEDYKTRRIADAYDKVATEQEMATIVVAEPVPYKKELMMYSMFE